VTGLTFLPAGMSPGPSPDIAYTQTWSRYNFKGLVSIVYRLGLPMPNNCFWSIGVEPGTMFPEIIGAGRNIQENY
jgi:hypothetical protein